MKTRLSNRKKYYRYLFMAAVGCAVLALLLLLTGRGEDTGWFLTLMFICLSIAFRGYEHLKGFSFTVLIFASVTVAMFFPAYFQQLGNFDLKKLITPLLQLIMFGMGTAMSLHDFAGVVKMPKGVLVGMLCQFTIMPLVGFSLAHLIGVDAEIAAGIILIGSAPSGLASNVMAYLAKANLALSVTLTAMATLMAPVVTPALMAWLAGEFIQINMMSMMWDMLQIVVIPVVAGLVFNYFAHGRFQWLDKALPAVSMFGIAYIITIITAAGRDALLEVGLVLIIAGVFHNVSGYFLGYWGARLFRMDERDCRTVALEVGMQNGGLASALANEMGRIATVGLAPAIFGPVMNITGSVLATYWRGKPLHSRQNPVDTIEKTETDQQKALT